MSIRTSVLLAALSCISACGTGGSHREGNTDAGGSAGTGSLLLGGGDPEVPTPERLDLLLMIDNSWAMDSKYTLLADSISQFLERAQNPRCVTANGQATSAPGPSGACAAGQAREFGPIRDIHVGVISSSLGDGGDNQICSRPESRDMSHLVGSLPRGAATGADEDGILKWKTGESFDDFRGALHRMVLATGQLGCGYEQSLEAWYRFLVDPAPYASLERVRCRPESATTDCMGPAVDASGQVLLDQTVLAQRAAFLRPDSLLMIVTLSDENDCSIRVGGQSWRLASTEGMPRAASVCGENPNAACCYACGASVPEGCSPDPICSTAIRLTREEDAMSLRCFEQKRRFGADFLYPTERYVHALSSRELCLKEPSLATEDCSEPAVDNPLFAQGRPLSHVVLASIVGVPWQSIRKTTGDADGSFRLETAEELNSGTWDEILGQPSQSPPVPPSDPFMTESADVRSGIAAGNPINGREYDTAYGATLPRDLQHACLFRLPQPVDCSGADPNAVLPCACTPDVRNSPVCEDAPGESPPGAIQYWARAYPGLRHLEVLRGQSAAGGHAVVGSICTDNASDPSRSDYGYRPVVDALVSRIAPRLQTP
jgi:hypothetical protein